MPHYIDTGNDQTNECLGEWLNKNLVAGLGNFPDQFGYFEINALLPCAQILADAAQQGKVIHFVLGANDGDLSAQHVRGVLQLVENTGNGSLTVIRHENALFHPKALNRVR